MNFIKAHLKFNRLWEYVSTLDIKDPVKIKAQYMIVYNYGNNLIIMYPKHYNLLDETVQKLQIIETMYNLKRKYNL